MKNLSSATFALIAFFSFLKIHAQSNEIDLIRPSETYELANIILALTDYGKTDPWEVDQSSDYYREVRAYFDKFDDHPLLAKVNFSREKWDSYLSFRTDAYAFTFNNNNQIIRTKTFYANNGLNPFEENLELINDFVKRTDFIGFYQRHAFYYEELSKAYLQSQHYSEMLNFLNKEFGKKNTSANYAIVMSPLVGRMNCHRVVEGVATDFITIPDFLLTGKANHEITNLDIATGTHMLFTELDHGFVNPITNKYRRLLKNNFVAAKWDTGSGYEKDSLATFNEYMTWAVYDIFLQTFFPKEALEASMHWALQNETRGFYASTLFNLKLRELYNHRKPGQTIKSLYPTFIKSIGQIQDSLRIPLISYCNLDDKTITTPLADFEIHFSEPMLQSDSLDIIRIVKQGGETQLNRILLTQQNNYLKWYNNGTILTFKLDLVRNSLNEIVFNYPWKVKTVLKSRKGVAITPYTTIKTTVQIDGSVDNLGN